MEDLKEVVALVQQRHPDLPVYVLGESMGGAVSLVALTDADAPQVDGLILSAPAVWGRETMAWHERFGLWWMSNLNPNFALTQEGAPQTLRVTDNEQALERMRQDPKMLRTTNFGTLGGLVDLMDAALAQASQLNLPTLLLYGHKDEVIKPGPMRRFVQRLPKVTSLQVTLYEQGHHLLLRDRNAPRVMQDIQHWVLGSDTYTAQVSSTPHPLHSSPLMAQM